MGDRLGTPSGAASYCHVSCDVVERRAMMFRALRLHLSLLSCDKHFRWRPYRVECTGSLSTSEVKRHRARLVLGWGTAWEHLRVLPAFLRVLEYRFGAHRRISRASRFNRAYEMHLEMTRPGLEPGISGSGGRRLIH